MSPARQVRPQVSIREFEPADAPALWGIFFSSIRQLAAADYSPEQIAAWAPAEVDPEKWAARMRGIWPFVAEVAGQPVGYADLQPNGYIDHFFVSPAVARRGVGTALMRRIHDQAKRQQLGRLFADVSLTARPFFEHFGFSLAASQTVLIGGVTLRNYRMAKVLPCK